MKRKIVIAIIPVIFLFLILGGVIIIKISKIDFESLDEINKGVVLQHDIVEFGCIEIDEETKIYKKMYINVLQEKALKYYYKMDLYVETEEAMWYKVKGYNDDLYLIRVHNNKYELYKFYGYGDEYLQ